MSRCAGARSLTIFPSMNSRPSLIDSSPAIIRSVVLFPHPDGPTSTTSSPSATSRSTACTATAPPSYTLRSPSSVSRAMLPPCAPPERGASRSNGNDERHERFGSLSQWIPLGGGDLRVPDRRLPPRRWRGAEHLGALRPHAGDDAQRRHRRRRV